MQNQLLAIVLLPLIAALVTGFAGGKMPRHWAHWITTLSVAISCLLSINIAIGQLTDQVQPLNYNLYTWAQLGSFSLNIGFMIDDLTATMMAVVTFVSLMVHIYTIGYMKDDPGYQRFFAYISLFTFAMLTLVMSNNFLQLFFGWEAVGLVSYLLIGFWYKKPTAIFANLKAFLVNRVGDFGFLLGIAGVYMVFGTLDYAEVFKQINEGYTDLLIPVSDEIFWSATTFICIGLFIGAMGKSAQVPLHVWLPDSMEGPTPISALIHAATMVTAGVFMVARMSPIFEQSEIALNFIMVIGGTTALFMGFLGVVQNDIKRIIAYSTLSQLGYMVVALGASAYSIAMFHLVTHAFFKALLFLGAGSVIIAMHHEQNIRNMGGLWKRMPITYVTSLIGTLALIGFPAFSGFFSKESIIEAVHLSELPGAHYVYWMVLSGVFITAFYSLRLFILVFHGKPRMSDDTYSHVHETRKVVTIPLIILAICSVFAGYAIEPMIYGDFFAASIHVSEQHGVMAKMADHFHGVQAMISHGFKAQAFYLLLGGVALAWLCYSLVPSIPKLFAPVLAIPTFILTRKYGFDWLYVKGFARLGVGMGKVASALGDRILIDGLMVNGTANMVRGASMQLRKIQSGYLYQYAFAMIIGLLGLLTYFYFQT